MDYGKFVFRDFSAKQYKKQFLLQFNQFLGNEKSHSPNGRVICDLHSPDTFDTRLGERASANVQPWTNQNSLQLPVTCSKRGKNHMHKVRLVWFCISLVEK